MKTSNFFNKLYNFFIEIILFNLQFKNIAILYFYSIIYFIIFFNNKWGIKKSFSYFFNFIKTMIDFGFLVISKYNLVYFIYKSYHK